MKKPFRTFHLYRGEPDTPNPATNPEGELLADGIIHRQTARVILLQPETGEIIGNFPSLRAFYQAHGLPNLNGQWGGTVIGGQIFRMTF